MKILLPPSETKTDGASETPLDFESLSFPELLKTRRKVASALIALSKKPRVARERLGISEKLDAERLRNIELLAAKTSPAHSIYSGVLYDALDYSSLSTQAKAVADQSIIVQSALFGWVRFGDAIPPYRLSGDTKLFTTSSLAQVWKPAITQAVRQLDTQELIVDMRSGNYAQHWTPSTQDFERTVEVKVVQYVGTKNDVKKIAVSHFNKATKGKIAASLLEVQTELHTPAQLHAYLTDAGYRSALIPQTAKKPAVLEVEML